MINVFYDDERINVRLNKNIYKQVLDMAEKADYFEYLNDIGIVSLPPTRRIAKKLYEMKLEFDSTAEIFIKDLKKVTVNTERKNPFDFSELSPLELRPYQQEGVLWMLKNNFHFLLGDEMGLGKTIQIASYLFYKQSFPALIICPASLKLNWEREINKWTQKKCIILDGLNPYPVENYLNEFPVVIINYDILGRKDKLEVEYESKRIIEAKKHDLPYKKKTIHPKGWIDILKQIPFKTIVNDECQFIGNMETARSQCVIDLCKGVETARRIFLSGTPYTAATKQFFPTLHLINGKIFNNKWRFQMEYCNPVKNRYGWTFDGLSNGKQLYTLVSSLMLRRLKKDVLTELPDKIKSIIPMKVDKKQYEKYQVIEHNIFKSEMKDERKSYQELKFEVYNAKAESCIQWIKEYLEYNNKLVVFVYHRDCFHKLLETFPKIAIGINGETPINKRQEYVDKFQNSIQIKLFIGQIKAAGVGITLTAASAVAFVEFGDTASQHGQAEDRIHRIGQESDKVIIYYLIAPGTIDENIIENIETGYANQKKVLDGDENAKFIDTEESGEFVKNVLKARKNKLYNNI